MRITILLSVSSSLEKYSTNNVDGSEIQIIGIRQSKANVIAAVIYDFKSIWRSKIGRQALWRKGVQLRMSSVLYETVFLRMTKTTK